MINGLKKIILIGLSFGIFGVMSQNGYAADTPNPEGETSSLSNNQKSEGQKDEGVSGSSKQEVVVFGNQRDPLPTSFFEMVTTPSCWSTSTKICVGVATGVAIGAFITYFYMNSKNDGIDTKPSYDYDAEVIKMHQAAVAREYFRERSGYSPFE